LPVGDPKKKKEAMNHSKVFCWEKNGPKLPYIYFVLEQKFEITLCSTTIGGLWILLTMLPKMSFLIRKKFYFPLTCSQIWLSPLGDA
jgi:hypothetical protein